MRWLFLLLFSIHLIAQERVLYHLDFKGIADCDDATSVLKEKGLGFQLDKKKFHFFIKDETLYIETKKKGAVLFGKIFHKGVDKILDNPTRAEIKWGVEQFPNGANWDEGNNRVPIALILVFGTEKLPSGIGFLAPKVPTFLCPFIGEKEQVGKKYLGRLYKKGGRYYCVSNEGGKVVVTNFQIEQIYKKEFEKSPPPLTAFAFQINTNDTKGGAKSFLKSFTLYGK